MIAFFFFILGLIYLPNSECLAHPEVGDRFDLSTGNLGLRGYAKTRQLDFLIRYRGFQVAWA